LKPSFYFGAVLYKYTPMPRKTIFGNQTAAKGVILPFTENDVEKVENRIYNELKAKPIPK